MSDNQMELEFDAVSERSSGARALTVKDLVIELLMAAGARGMSGPELCVEVLKRRDASAVDTYISQMARRGMIARLGTARETRFFGTPEQAERGRRDWEAWCRLRRKDIDDRRRVRHKRSERDRVAAEREADRARRAARAQAQVVEGWDASAALASWRPGRQLKGRAPWDASTPGIITPATKITVCPSPPQALRTNTHGRMW